MADHQPNDKEQGDAQFKGGWQQPRPLSGLAAPEQVRAAPAPAGGWRVPAIPEDLPPSPETQGGWHRPEQTSFKPEDVIEISVARARRDAAAPPPEDVALADEALAAEAEPAAGDIDSFAGLSELIAMVSLVDQPRPPRIVLKPEDVEAEAPLVGDVEREALAREAEAGEAAEAPPSPADFAREQLEALGTEATEEPIPVDVSGVDAAAFAREQVAALLDDTQAGDFTPVEAAPAVDVEREALAQKFLDTEAQVRELRRQQQAGLITREELQERLRKMLILDEDQNWWMMGVDTDIWYRFDPVQNNWIPATPPRPTAPRSEGALPYLGDEPQRESYYGTGVTEASLRLGEDEMPLPRQVPVTDPDYTVPSMGAVTMDTVRRPEGLTLEGTRPYTPDITQPAAAMPAAGAMPAASEAYTGVPSISFQEAAEMQRRDNLRRILLVATLIIGAGFILGALFLVFVIVLPYNNIANQYRDRINALADAAPSFQTGFILDKNGETIAERNSAQGARQPVNLERISPDMIYATVGVQDRRYYETAGFDPLAIVGAFLGGASTAEETITQRVARLLVLDQAVPTAQNRLTEFVVASELARTYDKNEILALYLNNVFFGNQSYGIESAARFYFRKGAVDLDLTESAMLVGLIADPSTNDPVINPQNSFRARDENLRALATVGCLNFQHAPYLSQPYCVDGATIVKPDGEFADGVLVPRALTEAEPYLPRAQADATYPHFANFVEQQIDQIYGAGAMYRLGLKVTTTLDPRIQQAAQSALVNQLRRMPLSGVNTGAVMVTDPSTGAILAMVGSPDFNNTQIQGQTNGALTWQQPGQAITPVIYTAALENVGDRNSNGALDYDEYMTPATLLWNVPTSFQNPLFTPVNEPVVASGPVALRYALAQSINIPAVKAYNFIGNDLFVSAARRMGMSFRTDPPLVSLESAIGTTEVLLYDMMEAYGTLANTGAYVPLFAITSIVDANNQAITPPRPQAPPGTGVNPQAAFLIQSILSDNTARAPRYGDNSPLQIPQFGDRVAVKVGNSPGRKDLWAMGFTRNVVVGVWMGHPDDNVTTQGDAPQHAAPVWNEVMRAALGVLPQPQPFQAPDIQNVPICATTGTQAYTGCPQPRNELFNVRQPPPPADQGPVVTRRVDTWTGLLADQTYCNESTEDRVFVNISDNAALGWLRTGEGASWAGLLGLPANPQPVPTQACDVNTIRPNVRITQPVDNSVLQGVVSIVGFATGPNFSSYQIELIPAVNPNNIFIVAGPFGNQVPTEGPLGQFNSAQVPAGQYILRLNARSAQGGYFIRDTPITISNPTPTPQPSPTPTVFLTETTLPFPTTPGAQVLPPGPSFGTTPLPGPSFQEQQPPPLVTQQAGGGFEALGAPTPTIFIPGS